jgi:hypothetical protein
LGTLRKLEREGLARDWCERGDSNPHGFTRQILSPKTDADSKEDQRITSAESSKTESNPQPSRNRKTAQIIPFPKTGTEDK